MGLDRALGRAYRAGDVLVGVAANDKFKDLPLARRQRCDMGANDVQRDLQAIRRIVMRNGPFNGWKKLVR